VDTRQNPQTEVKLEYRLCHAHDEFHACMALEREVWNDPGLEVAFPLYVVTAKSGGQVIGAFAGDRMIGFTFAMPGLHGTRPYLHSHMTAVLPGFRDKGVGRSLKLFQRADALARGINLVEWTFDPLEIKNAHFNLMRLGAVVRRFLPNCYGVTGSPLHGGLPTDRLLAEWELDSGRVERCLRNEPPVASFSSRAERIAVPKSIGQLREKDPAAALQVQTRIRDEFLNWFGRGYVAVAIETGADPANYVLEPGDAA
jgi:predicted GNAT superfamily acetyltransferase